MGCRAGRECWPDGRQSERGRRRGGPIAGRSGAASTLASVTDCAACGSSGLVAHLKVAGDAGPDGLIPSTDRFGSALADIVRCTRCGHGQIEPMPAEAVLAEAYADAASDDYVDEEAG